MKEFRPVAMRYAKGKLFLADKGGMRVLVLDPDGAYVTSHDLAALIGAEDNRADLGVRGFNVDREGNVLFTVSPEFKAYVLSPGGELRAFGRSGSSPGGSASSPGSPRTRRAASTSRTSSAAKSSCSTRTSSSSASSGDEAGTPRASSVRIEVQVANGKAYVVQGARRGVSVFAVTPG